MLLLLLTSRLAPFPKSKTKAVRANVDEALQLLAESK